MNCGGIERDALGWLAPTGTAEEVRANRTKDGSPNYHRDLEGPARAAKAAQLAVRTLADALDVPHPGCLMYKSFDKGGRSIVIPTLGLKREEDAPRRRRCSWVGSRMGGMSGLVG